MKTTLIKKLEDFIKDSIKDTIVIDDRTDHVHLQNQIIKLPIEYLFLFDEFLNLEDKTILNKKGDIFKAIVTAYSSNQADEEGESSDEEEVKKVKDDVVMRAIETVKL